MISKKKSTKPKKQNLKKQNLKKLLFLIPVIIVFVLALFLMTKKSMEESTDTHVESTARDLFDFDANYKDRKVVVAYFSATGNTKKVAEKFAEIFKCDAVPIEPVVPYTERDLTSQDPDTRPMKESKYDPFNPPEEPEEDEELDTSIVTSLPDIKRVSFNRYDTIFLGYPIWYGDAPRIIYTFISQTNLKNKVIIPFCTSDNDDISPSDNNLANFAPDGVNFMTGKRFSENASVEEIKDYATKISVDINIWD